MVGAKVVKGANEKGSRLLKMMEEGMTLEKEKMEGQVLDQRMEEEQTGGGGQGVESDEDGPKERGRENGLGRVLTVVKRGQRKEEEKMDWAGC